MSGRSTQGPVPRFTSFKPKAAPEVLDGDLEYGEKPRATSKDVAGRRHHHHRHRRPRGRERPSTRERSPPPSVVPQDDLSSLYIIDRQGDVKNLVYGSVHRYSVPPFHRVGAGSVLGTERRLKIDRDFSDEKVIILNDRNANLGTRREKYVFARNEKRHARLLKIRAEVIADSSALEDTEFIPLQIFSRKRKRLGSASGGDSDNDREHYRSIEGKAKVSSKPVDEALEFFTESDSSDPDSGRALNVDEATRRKTIELSRSVEEHPGDIDAWIALIEHQDKLLGLGEDGRRNVTSAERRSTADIKLHLYEKALAKAGTTLAAQERLLLGLMIEGAKIWDFKTQSERWEQVTQNNLDSVLLWKLYLDFRQSAFTAFRYEEMKEIFLKRIKLLKSTIESQKHSEVAVRSYFESLIYTILRLTLFMRESGFSEISLAVWQALLEINFLGPSSLLSPTDRIELFKDFWESEVPRIGEYGATGWMNFKETADASDVRNDEETPQKYLKTSDIFDGWVSAENFRNLRSREPARTLDDVTEDDPYRVIIWSDIEDYFVDVTAAPDADHFKNLLVDAYLMFCRLPPCSIATAKTSRKWWADSFIRGEVLEWTLTTVNKKTEEENVTVLSAQVPVHDTSCPYVNEIDTFQHRASQSFAIEIDTMFGPPNQLKPFQPWKDLYGGDSGPVPYSWLRNILKKLGQVSSLELYYLAFEWCNEPESIKKVARALIKQQSQNLSLYNAYALIEWYRGNKDTSVNVISSALSMGLSLPEVEQQNCIRLWKTWSWLLLEVGDTRGSLKCLHSIADGIPDLTRIELSSPALFLKTKQYLSSMRDHLMSIGTIELANVYTEILALLVYMSSTSGAEAMSQNQGDITSALKEFDDYFEKLKARGHKDSFQVEVSHQAAAKLLYHHVQFGPFRPALVRQYMSQSLALFPQNTTFLSLYAWNESRLRIDDRVRSILRSTVLSNAFDNITSRLFAIRFEMQSGNVHSVRAAFENAVASPACSSNAGLWRLYIWYCAQRKELGKVAKEVFYRGVRACPWAKQLYLTAFVELKLVMGFEELREVYKVLLEKELRVHVDLEDRLEEWDERVNARRISRT